METKRYFYIEYEDISFMCLLVTIQLSLNICLLLSARIELMTLFTGEEFDMLFILEKEKYFSVKYLYFTIQENYCSLCGLL